MDEFTGVLEVAPADENTDSNRHTRYDCTYSGCSFNETDAEKFAAHLERHREFTTTGNNPCPKGCGRRFTERERQDLKEHKELCDGSPPLAKPQEDHPDPMLRRAVVQRGKEEYVVEQTDLKIPNRCEVCEAKTGEKVRIKNKRSWGQHLRNHHNGKDPRKKNKWNSPPTRPETILPGDVPEDHDTSEGQPPAAAPKGREVDVGDGEGGRQQLVSPDMPSRPSSETVMGGAVAQNGQRLDAAIQELEERRERVIEKRDIEVKAIDEAIASLNQVKAIQ